MCVDNMLSYQRRYIQIFISYGLVKKKDFKISCVFGEDVILHILKQVGQVVLVFFPSRTFAHSLCCFYQLLGKTRDSGGR
jgi:hypothetical protein